MLTLELGPELEPSTFLRFLSSESLGPESPCIMRNSSEIVLDASTTHEAAAQGHFQWHGHNRARRVMSHARMSRVRHAFHLTAPYLAHLLPSPVCGVKKCVKHLQKLQYWTIPETNPFPTSHPTKCVHLSGVSSACCPVLPSPYENTVATLRRGSMRNCQKNPECSRRCSKSC